MRIIKPSVELFPPVEQQNLLKHIERCGRVCYKSEDKITDDSAPKFVSGIIKRGHEAVLEHGSFIFEMNKTSFNDFTTILTSLEQGGFRSFLRITCESRPVVSGNVRAWRDFLKACAADYFIPAYMKEFIKENGLLFPEFQSSDLYIDYLGFDDIKFSPLSAHDLQEGIEQLTHTDMTAHFIVDRGVSHEIVRHRPASFCQESTRYCSYIKDKFGNEITVILPLFFDTGMGTASNSLVYDCWKTSCERDEEAYFKLLGYGATPQQARSVLPTSLKTEVMMTANLTEWIHFLKLRCSPAAHPQMVEVAVPLLKQFTAQFQNVFNDIEVEK